MKVNKRDLDLFSEGSRRNKFTILEDWKKSFLKIKGDQMGDKGKRDKGKREEQKKGKHTLKEKRKQKKDKK